MTTRYGVTASLTDLYYEIEADDQDEAIQKAFDLAYDEVGNIWDLSPDCNECLELDNDD